MDSTDNQSMTEHTWHMAPNKLLPRPRSPSLSLFLFLCGKYRWIEVCGSCGQLTMRWLSYHKLNRPRERDTERAREREREESEEGGRQRQRQSYCCHCCSMLIVNQRVLCVLIREVAETERGRRGRGRD